MKKTKQIFGLTMLVQDETSLALVAGLKYFLGCTQRDNEKRCRSPLVAAKSGRFSALLKSSNSIQPILRTSKAVYAFNDNFK